MAIDCSTSPASVAVSRNVVGAWARVIVTPTATDRRTAGVCKLNIQSDMAISAATLHPPLQTGLPTAYFLQGLSCCSGIFAQRCRRWQGWHYVVQRQRGRQFQCDQHYVAFDVETVPRILACHETGHAVGLTHGRDANPEVSSSASSLSCMQDPLGTDAYIGSHNAAQVNSTY